MARRIIYLNILAHFLCHACLLWCSFSSFKFNWLRKPTVGGTYHTSYAPHAANIHQDLHWSPRIRPLWGNDLLDLHRMACNAVRMDYTALHASSRRKSSRQTGTSTSGRGFAKASRIQKLHTTGKNISQLAIDGRSGGDSFENDAALEILFTAALAKKQRIERNFQQQQLQQQSGGQAMASIQSEASKCIDLFQKYIDMAAVSDARTDSQYAAKPRGSAAGKHEAAAWLSIAILCESGMTGAIDAQRVAEAYVNCINSCSEDSTRLALIAFNNLISFYLQRRLLTEAAEMCQLAVDRYPTEPSTWCNMGVVLRISSNPEWAKVCFENAAKLIDAAAATAAAVAAVTPGTDIETATNRSSDGFEGNPPIDARVTEIMPLIEAETDMTASTTVVSNSTATAGAAVDIPVMAITWDDPSITATVFNNLGVLCETVGSDVAAAERCYRRALQVSDYTDESSLFNLAVILRDKQTAEAGFGRRTPYWTEAEALLEQLLQVNPQSVQAQFQLAALRSDSSSPTTSSPPVQRAPAEYVTSLFDDYAANGYEQHMLGQLQYRVPALMVKLLQKSLSNPAMPKMTNSPSTRLNAGGASAAAEGNSQQEEPQSQTTQPAISLSLERARIVELGVGSGLLGRALREEAGCRGVLTGCDLSRAMIATAARRQYDPALQLYTLKGEREVSTVTATAESAAGQAGDPAPPVSEGDTGTNSTATTGRIQEKGTDAMSSTRLVYDALDVADCEEYVSSLVSLSTAACTTTSRGGAAGAVGAVDAVVAADMLVYLGKLDDLFGKVHQLLRPGGVFCFSIELQGDPTIVSHTLLSAGVDSPQDLNGDTADRVDTRVSGCNAAATENEEEGTLHTVSIGDSVTTSSNIRNSGSSTGSSSNSNSVPDYELLASGRFAHSKEYIENLAGAFDFSMAACQHAVLRWERDHPVHGLLVLLVAE